MIIVVMPRHARERFLGMFEESWRMRRVGAKV